MRVDLRGRVARHASGRLGVLLHGSHGRQSDGGRSPGRARSPQPKWRRAVGGYVLHRSRARAYGPRSPGLHGQRETTTPARDAGLESQRQPADGATWNLSDRRRGPMGGVGVPRRRRLGRVRDRVPRVVGRRCSFRHARRSSGGPGGVGPVGLGVDVETQPAPGGGHVARRRRASGASGHVGGSYRARTRTMRRGVCFPPWIIRQSATSGWMASRHTSRRRTGASNAGRHCLASTTARSSANCSGSPTRSSPPCKRRACFERLPARCACR